MSGNSKHSKNNLKMYVIIFVNLFYLVDERTYCLFFIQLRNYNNI